MANTDSPTKGLSFAISYGLVGGRAHSKKLNNLMRAEDYSPDILTTADIIIAHSAGCWLLPQTVKPKLIVYVGMPLAQASWRDTFLNANVTSFTHKNFLRSLSTKSKSTYYGLRQPRRNLNIIRMAKNSHSVIFTDIPSIFIANRYDPWPRSEQLQQFISSYDWAFISLPGSHDDIWERPQRYVAIINHYARLLDQANSR
jgi:hypothetical protein